MTARRPYAEGTTVTAERTRLEIEQLVAARGAEAFAFAIETGRAQIRFRMKGRLLRFDLPMPRPDEDRFVTVHRGAAGVQRRTPQGARSAWEKACREQWRALLLAIKAKLTAVEVGVVGFEEEFLAHVVLPDGRTVGELATQQLAIAYADGGMPRLLADYTGGRG